MNSKISNSHSGIFRNKRMIRSSDDSSIKLQFVLDVLAVELALYLSMYIKGIASSELYLYPALTTPLIMFWLYKSTDVYNKQLSRFSHFLALGFAWLKVVTILIVLAFALKVSEDFSRQVTITWLLMALPFQLFMHMVVHKFIHEYIKREPIPCLLVGNGEMARYLAKHINADGWSAHKIVGVTKDDDEPFPVEGVQTLGRIWDIRFIVLTYGIKRVYFALPMKTAHQIRDIQLDLLDLNVDIVWAPDIFGLHMLSPSVKEVAGVPLYYLSENPMVDGAGLSKWMMDKILSLLGVIVLSPLMLLVAIAIKIDSSGPVFFHQKRHGLDGKIIEVLKFRSMKTHQKSEDDVKQATKGDERVTRVGAFIRRTSIDELPQLFNVIKGEMSLVGPRPHALSHNDYFSSRISEYMSRHRVLPGITGLAQANGFRGETDTLEKMEKRVEYDLAYINNWSIWLDIQILIKTVYTLFSKNAY